MAVDVVVDRDIVLHFSSKRKHLITKKCQQVPTFVNSANSLSEVVSQQCGWVSWGLSRQNSWVCGAGTSYAFPTIQWIFGKHPVCGTIMVLFVARCTTMKDAHFFIHASHMQPQFIDCLPTENGDSPLQGKFCTGNVLLGEGQCRI